MDLLHSVQLGQQLCWNYLGHPWGIYPGFLFHSYRNQLYHHHSQASCSRYFLGSLALECLGIVCHFYYSGISHSGVGHYHLASSYGEHFGHRYF